MADDAIPVETRRPLVWWPLSLRAHAQARAASAAAAFEPKRVLLVITRQIGDVLLTTPLLAATRARWPRAAVDVLGFAGTLGMLEGRDDVAGRIQIVSRKWRPMLSLVASIWRRYDLALVADASDRAHLLAFAAAPVRSGVLPERRAHAWWKRLLLRHAVRIDGDRGSTHVADEKLALLAPWQNEATLQHTLPSPPPSMPLPDALEALLGDAPVVVHVPSAWRYKQWPIAHFRVLVAALLREGRQVVLTGAASREDRAKIDQLLDLGASPRLVDASGTLRFGQVATLLQRAALFIGPDTSVTHLAAAVGVPVVTLFGPTNPLRWAPIGPLEEAAFERRSIAPQRRGNVVLIQGPGPCVPCGRAGCDDHRSSASACLEGIAPELVLEQAHRFLGAAPEPCATPR